MKKLKHPNIVQYISHFQDQADFNIIMELCENGVRLFLLVLVLSINAQKKISSDITISETLLSAICKYFEIS